MGAVAYQEHLCNTCYKENGGEGITTVEGMHRIKQCEYDRMIAEKQALYIK